MAKKEKTVPIRNINYIKIINEMDKPAFEYCVSLLYSLYNYRVIQPKDIRKIDIQEHLCRVENQIPEDFRKKTIGTYDFYLLIIQHLFNKYFICKEGSKAEKYKERGNELIEAALNEKGSLSDIEDIFLIMLSLIHQIPDKLDGKEKIEISDCRIQFEECDAELIQSLMDSKRIAAIMKGIKPGGFNIVVGTLSDNEIQMTSRFFYINNVVFLARALQNMGKFELEERE